jgi:hypothetical protein
MSTTIAIALITAVSTLAGASISGYIAFLISHTQGKTQEKITQSQQIEQRIIERRQIRIDAYLQFLNLLGVAEKILDNLWQANSPGILASELADFQKPAADAISELWRVKDLVWLEGPGQVSLLAIKLGTQLLLECTDIIRTAREAPKEVALVQYDGDTFTSMRNKRNAMKLEFIAAAQKSLDL